MDFQKWFADCLMSSRVMREQLMEHPRADQKTCMRVASEFIWNYGWRRSDYGLPHYKPEELKVRV